MPNDAKNKFKDNFILRQTGFIVLIILWALAIVFKEQFTGTLKTIVFIVLLLATVGEVYLLNRAFFGLTSKSQENAKNKEKK